MGSKRIFLIFSLVCLALSIGFVKALAAEQNETSLKGHEGTWISIDSAGNISYIACASNSDSPGRAYTCSGHTYSPDGMNIPIYGDGYFTGKDTYREKIVARFDEEGFPFPVILVVTASGRFKGEDTAVFNQISSVYFDMNGDGMPNENEFIFTNPTAKGIVQRPLSIFEDKEFPEYPPKT